MAEIREIELLHTISEDETDKEIAGKTGITANRNSIKD